MAKAAEGRIAALSGKSLASPSSAAAGPAAAYGGPSGRTNSDCAQQARALAPVAARFDRYREALPSARAAADLNELGDKPGSAPATKPCLTRLPVDAVSLNSTLGLPANTLEDSDLRNDKSGFRAAMYRDESTGKLILVPRDTQPDSLVDWQANTRNGVGIETPQYQSMRNLTSILAANDQVFDIAGYSKGGGLAHEGGLLSELSQVRVFNAAGLPDESLRWTGQSDFGSLEARTKLFSAKGDFLTFMNSTSDPGQTILNARYLRNELAGVGSLGKLGPINIKTLNPASRGTNDPLLPQAKADYIAELDDHIASMQAAFDGGGAVQGFPPVRAASKEVIADSSTWIGDALGAGNGRPNLGKLNQHKMDVVLNAMESNVSRDRTALKDFMKVCG